MIRQLDYRSRRNAEMYRFAFDPLDSRDLAEMARVIFHMGLNDDFDLTLKEAVTLLRMVQSMAFAEKGIAP